MNSKTVTIVKSTIKDRPRYRVIEGLIENDDQLKNLDPNMRITRSFNKAVAVATAILFKDGNKSGLLSIYETTVDLPDPKKDTNNK